MRFIKDYVLPLFSGMIMALPLALFVRGFASLRQRKLNISTTQAHEIGAALLVMYCGGILSLLVMEVPAMPEWPNMAYNFIPLRFMYDMFSGRYAGEHAAALAKVLGGAALFVPLGFMLSLLWRGASWAKALLGAAALSLFVELCQLVMPYRIADIDDVIFASLGGFLGFCVYRLIKAEAVERFRVNKIKKLTNLRE